MDEAKKSSTDNLSTDSLSSKELNPDNSTNLLETNNNNNNSTEEKVRENQNIQIWASYYENLKNKQTILKGCF